MKKHVKKTKRNKVAKKASPRRRSKSSKKTSRNAKGRKAKSKPLAKAKKSVSKNISRGSNRNPKKQHKSRKPRSKSKTLVKKSNEKAKVKKSRAKRVSKKVVRPKRNDRQGKGTRKSTGLSFDVSRVKRFSRKNYVEINNPTLTSYSFAESLKNWSGNELDYLFTKNKPIKGAGYKLPLAVILIIHFSDGSKDDVVSFISPPDLVVKKKEILNWVNDVLNFFLSGDWNAIGLKSDLYSINYDEIQITKIQIKFLY